MKAKIYHNPMCGTSRKTLEILRDSEGTPDRFANYDVGNVGRPTGVGHVWQITPHL